MTVSRNATWTWILAVTLCRIKAGQSLSLATEPRRQLERILSLCYIMNGRMSLQRCCSLKLNAIPHIAFTQYLILKGNIEAKLPAFNQQDMKTYVGVEVFLKSTIAGTERQVSLSCRLTHG